MGRRVLLLLLLALVAAPSAAAHAILVGTDPPNGSVLGSSPTVVTATFDTPVRPGSRCAAIRNDGTDVLGGKPFVRQSRTLVIPLKPKLRDGQYTVRWCIVSNDGHQEEGVIAFAIGKGSGTPVAALGARGFVTWQQVVMRTVFLLGVLVGVGGAFFGLVVLRPLRAGADLLRRHAHLLFLAFLLAFAGADALIHATSGSATRFEHVLDVAAVAAVAGGAAAALAPLWAPLLYVAWAAGAVLFLCPTLSGHALDPDQPRLVAPAADLLHVGAASVWLGGVASLLLVLHREPEQTRHAAALRYSAVAGPAVLLVLAAGASRALTELSSASQLWTTGYGRAILAKTGLYAVLVAVGWLARQALARTFARLRPIVLAELVLLTCVVVAVGTLTTLRPGAATPKAAKATPPVVVQPPPPPPAGAFVDAAQAGRLAVSFAYQDGKAIVTLLGPDGNGATGVPVTMPGSTHACGRGCFSSLVAGPAVDVRVGTTDLRFRVPQPLRPAAAELRRVRRDYDSLSSLVLRERLSSAPSNFQLTVFRERAPDRMAYRIVAASTRTLVGTEGIVIGGRRWDRLPGGRWVRSQQSPLRVPTAYWTAKARNAYWIAPDEIAFYDPTFPAWFRVRVDRRTGHAVELRMVAAAHFMHHVYSGFDRPVSISPPPAR